MNFLKNSGYRVVEQNFYSRYGEIDIVAIDQKEVLHFIEVKSGQGFDPAENLTEKKLNRILRTVDFYLLKRDIDNLISIDLITIEVDEVQLFKNITI